MGLSSKMQDQGAVVSGNCVSLSRTDDPRVRAKGLEALYHLLGIYLQMLAIVAFLALWLTLMYGTLSYISPHIICREQIEEGLSKVRTTKAVSATSLSGMGLRA
jgi:hypothetical protein